MYWYVGTPIIVDHPRDQNVDLLSKVSFMCSADGFPRPHIVWIKNNTILRDKIASSAGRYKRKIYAANTTGNCTISECGVDSTIVINDVTADDLGVYTCKGSNEVGYAIESAQLTNGILGYYAVRILKKLKICKGNKDHNKKYGNKY